MADALLEHEGSGRQSFERARENGQLQVTPKAVYEKLGRLPLAVSEAFLAEGTERLLELLPAGTGTERVPAALQKFTVLTLDGKVVKNVPKRLLPLRAAKGGVLGGKALVAVEMASGLATAIATDEDGETNEASLVPQLLPVLRQRYEHILWLADRQFGDPAQAAAFMAREGDHFLLRYHQKTKFYRDEERDEVCGEDARGRRYQEEWGWWGSPSNKQRRKVRRVTLYRPGQEDIILVTDLTDAETYPAVDLLDLYLARWGIERVFQVITEVFSLQRLVGTTPQGTLFQLGFCLLLYNMIQVVRAYVAVGAGDKPDAVSTELLYVDVQRQLIALHEMLEPEQIVSQFVPVYEAQQLQDRLRELLEPTWTERWRKAKPKKRSPPKAKGGKREHTSAYRVLQEYRLAKKEPPSSKRP